MFPTDRIKNLTYDRGWLRNTLPESQGGGGLKAAWLPVVAPGDILQVTFAIETNKQVSDLPGHMYFSTNNYITTSDTFLGSATFDLGVRHAFRYTTNITIPAQTSHRGYASVGLLLNPSGVLEEWSSINSAAYIPIYVTGN